MEILGKARASGGGVQAKATGVFSKTSGGKSDGGGGGGGGGAKAISSEEVSYLANRVAYLDEALKKAGGGIDALKSQIGAKTSAQGYAQTAKKFQNAVTKSTLRMTESAFRFQYALITLLLLFILHQLFVWVDQDPDVAFERAALVFEGVEITWDMSRVLYNGGVDIMNAGVIPLWNTATYYLVEPTVVLSLEVFSLIFMKQHWEGLMTEADFPYNGLDCLANQEAMAWCGRYGYYKEKLEEPARAAIFVNESESFARRMLQRVPDDHTFTFGLATARRLSEQGGGGFSAPAFPTDVLTEALGELTIFFTTMVPSLLDVAFGVIGDIIQTSFSILMDAFFMVLKSVFFVLKMLVSKTYATRTTYSQHLGQSCKCFALPVRRERDDHHSRHPRS